MLIQHDIFEEKGDETPQSNQTTVPDGDVPPRQNLEELERGETYPTGTSFAVLTIGLMAVVLVLALDNYIISKLGQEQRHYRQEAANLSSDGRPYSHHPFQ